MRLHVVPAIVEVFICLVVVVFAEQVPYIWQYKRDLLHPAMTISHLWRIMDLDFEFSEMHSRRL